MLIGQMIGRRLKQRLRKVLGGKDLSEQEIKERLIEVILTKEQSILYLFDNKPFMEFKLVQMAPGLPIKRIQVINYWQVIWFYDII